MMPMQCIHDVMNNLHRTNAQISPYLAIQLSENCHLLVSIIENRR